MNENWQYYGDLQQDNLKWNDIENILTYMERPKNCDTVWLRIKIPSANWVSPAIYFQEIYGESISMYINERLNFDNKHLRSNNDKKSFIVPIIPDDYGHYLYIKISLNLYHRFSRQNVYFEIKNIFFVCKKDML